MKRRLTPGEIVRAELAKENKRQRWLLDTFGPESEREVARVHRSRPSASSAGKGNANRRNAGHPFSALGVFGLAVLFAAAGWLVFFGLIWLAFQVLRWVGNLVWGVV